MNSRENPNLIQLFQETFPQQTRFLEFIINSISSGIVVANSQGRFILFNPAAEDLLGVGLTEVLPEQWTERYGCYLPDRVTPYPPRDLPLARALRGETVSGASIFIRNPQKPKGLLLSVDAGPVWNDKGELQGGVAVFYDVTERRKAEEELRKSERRYADLFYGAADPIVILDPAGNIQSLNPAAERVSGYKESELAGKNFVEAGVLAPSSIQKALQEFTRTILEEEVSPFEIDILTRSGIPMTFEANERLIRNEGEISGVQVIFRDITERKRSEKRTAIQYAVTRVLAEAFRKEEVISRCIEAIAESLGWDFGAMWEVAEKNQKMRCVQTWQRADFTPDVSSGFLPGSYAAEECLEAGRAAWFQEGPHSRFCFPVRSGGETAGVMEFFCRNFRPADPELLEMFNSIGSQIGQFLDRRKTERELQQKQLELAKSHAECEQLQIFAYVASHDLQEPLQKILAYAHLVKMDTDHPLQPKTQGYLEKLEQASLRMGALIADLLKFIKTSSKESVLEQVNLSEIVRQVLKDFDDDIEKYGVRVECGPLPMLRADGRQMQQLFQNLISNAIKFRKKETPLRLTLSSRDAGPGYVEILVEDNGIGFDEKHLERLFKPFERLHGWQEYPGSGIGLAICRKIAEQHRGTISARSYEGKGTMFFIRLPLTQERS